MRAEVITIGDELLLGQTIDTNSAWMGEHLALAGITVKRIVSIADDAAEIVSALDDALTRSDLVLVTGGLGPTRDDITKAVLADYFKTPLIMNEDVLINITEWFNGKGLDMLEVNRQQARMPAACEVLDNPQGTAQGMWFNVPDSNRVVVSMPGVPYEMKGIMREQVIPRLRDRMALPLLCHRTILTQGIGESYLSELVKDWEEGLADKGVSIAYLPATGQVRVRLSAVGEKARECVNQEVGVFKTMAANWVISDNDETLAFVLGRELQTQGLTCATAESCTGGAIAGSLTSQAGSSAYFLGSVVAYSNEVKSQVLGVDEEDLKKMGPVSDTVVRQMAEGVRRLTGADYAIATTGIAGPDGGTESAPVGTVWVSIASSSQTWSKCLQLGQHRGRNISRAVSEAQAWLFRILRQDKSLR